MVCNIGEGGGGGGGGGLIHEKASKIVNRPELRIQVIVSVKISLLETKL